MISRIHYKILTGLLLREEEGLTILICKLILIVIIFLSITFKGYTNDFKSSKYGSYLSWDYAKDNRDLENLKILLKQIDLKKIEDASLEEVFFESVIFDEWTKAEEISSILLEKDRDNFSANLFKFFLSFVNGQDSDQYLKKVDYKYLDSNFINSILIWKNYSKENIEISNHKNCVPLICLHSALILKLKGENKEAQNFFNKIEDEKFVSYRIKELLLLNAIQEEKKSAKNILNQINSYDLNIKNFDLNYLLNNQKLLNPVENKQDGMAEVLYNISSWFFSKDLYKYSTFFGKISLKLRPDFNAMKLLLLGNYEKLGYKNLGINYAKNLNTDNLYYYKFLRMKLSLFEDLNKDEEFILDLKKFTQTYPDKVEMKILLANKYRKLEQYEKAVKIYSEIINNKLLSSNWNIFYSRGISYERMNDWNKAEKDLKEAMRLNPDDPYILNYLAYSWLDRNKNVEKALSLLKKAVEIEPDDAYIIDSLGWAFFLSDQTDKSIFFLEKAVSILPDDATLNDHLGDAYWKAGRQSEAKSQWKRVLILDPQFKKKNVINSKIKNGL